MADDRMEQAISIVATRVMANCLRREVVDDPGEWWGRFEEIGEHDWNLVVEEIEKWIGRLDPPAEEFDAAYDYLGARADAE